MGEIAGTGSDSSLLWVECPRDAWQGLATPIPVDRKVEHLRNLIDAGFTNLDLGSFVSPRAVPQMADTEEVLARLERPEGTDFLCIVANMRGLDRAAAARGVTTVGYPLSLSEAFQRRNTGAGLEAGWATVEELRREAAAAGLGLVVYLSMGFGNPFGDPWGPEDTAAAAERLADIGVGRIVLADTVGTANGSLVADVLAACREPSRLGLHLHAAPGAWEEVVGPAWDAGVRWFEGALAGIGGCPFAGDELVGNLPTEKVLPWLVERGAPTPIRLDELPGLSAEAGELALLGRAA